MEQTKVICITPVKNEGWILKKFLQATSLWADHIIVANQNSTDQTEEIAKQFEKVILVDNNSIEFNEAGRQQLLLEEARKIPGKKLIIALDADEFLTPNWKEELELIKQLPEGTLVQFLWRNIHPNLKSYWTPNHRISLGYIDDGKMHRPSQIHSVRVPFDERSPKYMCKDISVLHLQYIDWDRMKSKHRWYQCYEKIHFPEKHPIDIFRMYHHMYEIEKDLKDIPEFWYKTYEQLDIKLFDIQKQDKYWWDEEVVKYLKCYGPSYFRGIWIWEKDWNEFARKYGLLDSNSTSLDDPREDYEKRMHEWLMETQPISNNQDVKYADTALKKIFGVVHE